jgi:transposase
MWPDQKAHGPFGELSSHCAQDVTKGWSAGYFETMRRRQAGQEAGLPLKKHHLVPVTWRKGEFALCPSAQASRARVTLSCAKGRPPLTLRLARDHPYDPDLVRSIRLQEEAGDLFVDITAWVGVIDARTDPELAAGVDPGIIHPLALAVGETSLLVSGRALRAEEFLHLEDSKARDRAKSKKRAPVSAQAGSPRKEGSRRWRKIHAAQKKHDARNRRVVKAASNRAANLVAEAAVDAGASVVAIGNPAGIEHAPAGRVHQRRVHRWGRAYSRNALHYRLEECGVNDHFVEERGTSSFCPDCGAPATKSGRWLVCKSPICGKRHHRDIAGAQNMVRKIGRVPREIARQEHRRVGTPSRRDRRRVSYERTRSTTTPDVEARTWAATGEPVESLVA